MLHPSPVHGPTTGLLCWGRGPRLVVVSGSASLCNRSCCCHLSRPRPRAGAAAAGQCSGGGGAAGLAVTFRMVVGSASPQIRLAPRYKTARLHPLSSSKGEGVLEAAGSITSSPSQPCDGG